MTVSIEQACGVYGDLLLAFMGKASHGYEAEIYVYRLMPNCPSEQLPTIGRDVVAINRIKAAKSLAGIIDIFREIYDCVVLIDGEDYSTWVTRIYSDYDHRVKVKVERLDVCPNCGHPAKNHCLTLTNTDGCPK